MDAPENGPQVEYQERNIYIPINDDPISKEVLDTLNAFSEQKDIRYEQNSEAIYALAYTVRFRFDEYCILCNRVCYSLFQE